MTTINLDTTNELLNKRPFLKTDIDFIQIDISNNIDILKNELTNYASENIQQNALEKLNANKNKGITNNRKSYYEAQQYDILVSWAKTFRAIYYVLALMIILILFLSQNSFGLYFRIFLTVCFIIYPFVIDIIYSFIVRVWSYITVFFPHNVYKKL
jgi:hypothetical protein